MALCTFCNTVAREENSFYCRYCVLICPRCMKGERKKTRAYCQPCASEYQKRWRKTHPLNEQQRLRDISRSYANVYLHRGKITKHPCALCENPSSQMHHYDYSKPTSVIWLCQQCHTNLHAEYGFDESPPSFTQLTGCILCDRARTSHPCKICRFCRAKPKRKRHPNC